MNDTFWHDRAVFVTGATGLMGGWLVHALVERGARVVALVRDRVPESLAQRDGLLERVRVVHGSLEDPGLLRRTLAEYEVATVFHLAAQAIVGAAKIDPVGTLEANVRGTWHVLDACRQAGTPGVVIASSDKAYGAAESLPYLETHRLEGRYPYDVSKSCADLIATMYARTYGLRVGIARCANLFGPGDLNFSRLVPDAIRCTLAGRRFAIRSDGRYVRDLIYVKDGAEAYLRLAEALHADPALAGEAFNFSMETRATVLEIVQTVLGLMGREDLAPIIENVATGEIREQDLELRESAAAPRVAAAVGARRGAARDDRLVRGVPGRGGRRRPADGRQP